MRLFPFFEKEKGIIIPWFAAWYQRIKLYTLFFLVNSYNHWPIHLYLLLVYIFIFTYVFVMRVKPPLFHLSIFGHTTSQQRMIKSGPTIFIWQRSSKRNYHFSLARELIVQGEKWIDGGSSTKIQIETLKHIKRVCKKPTMTRGNVSIDCRVYVKTERSL